jgi:hypothetical protein
MRAERRQERAEGGDLRLERGKVERKGLRAET